MKNLSTKIKNLIIFILLSLPLILLDQWTKHLAVIELKQGKEITLIENVLYFVYHENRGAAFGILQEKQIFFYIITIIILLVVLFYIFTNDWNKKNILLYIALICIFGGAIGNFIDRFKNKFVVDFIYFKPIDFPVFNVADSFICIGAGLLILYVIFSKDNNKNTEIEIQNNTECNEENIDANKNEKLEYSETINNMKN